MLGAESDGRLGAQRLEYVNANTDDRPGLRMSLPARAENVAVARHALAGLGERLGMDEAAIADLKTVATEAAMNVVVHAYPSDEPGALVVEAFTEHEGLTVIVRDFGMGIRPRPDVERPSLRIGLTLIAALSSSFEISGGIDRGTEIRMHLALSTAASNGGADLEIERPPEDTEVRVGPPEMVGPVLSRVLGALAARHEITVDRLADTMLLSDAISAAAPQGFTDGHVELRIADREEGVELRVGPMTRGGAERLREGLDIPEVGSLEALADDLRVEQGDEGEFLVVAIDALSA
jgi:anti-sigma regulatory factor (Ser/Thr protein kinase)